MENLETERVGNINLGDGFSIVDSRDEKSEDYDEYVLDKYMKLDEHYDIKFTIGAELFENIATFMNYISYDVAISFRKDCVILRNIDPSMTHRARVTIDKTELSEYIIPDDGETDILVDFSLIESLDVQKKMPVDVYVDMTKKQRLYFVCGKSEVYNRLVDPSKATDIIRSDEKLDSLLERDEYERFVVLPDVLSKALNSTKKRREKRENMATRIVYNKNFVSFNVEDIDYQMFGKRYVMSGSDALVYPLTDGYVIVSTEYLITFSKLNLTQQVTMYMANSLPLFFDTRLGGGNIKVLFVIAPRIERDEE